MNLLDLKLKRINKRNRNGWYKDSPFQRKFIKWVYKKISEKKNNNKFRSLILINKNILMNKKMPIYWKIEWKTKKRGLKINTKELDWENKDRKL